MSNPRHLGIVAVSAEGAALCYRTICAEAAAMLGRHMHPEISMHTFPLGEYMRHIDAGRWHDVAALMLESARKLAACGADFLICPDNTAHQAFDLLEDRSPLRWLHIADEVARVAAECGFGRVGVLGTRYLMEGPVYPPKLAERGIAHEIPSREQRARINRIIFEDLVHGCFEESARAYFRSVIADLKARGCDAVALSCTEIPLLISPGDSPLPVLDSTRILARAALREATRAD
ncbi:MAG: amino acid racemase [Candidatus Binatus sp.]|uniref:aspartate/glutamate racemase family protein n=1 Tax=Candidatus Binatus sp. TaxID=2811406 RepID=UPI0027199105|nr:amino acid racemase [Candidatus Binatus sp.]MDO8434379.1 amino acid racemase [Candidatus Binatus sp.]